MSEVKKAEFVQSAPDVTKAPKPNIPEFAFIGRSNVGKSSLINMLCQRKGLAKTSGSPGKTRLINHFIINDLWYLVDLPGYGYAKVSKKDRANFMRLIYDYFEQRENMVNAFVLLDSRHAPQQKDLEFMEWLGTNGIPFSMVFTKIDKLSSTELRKNLEAYKKEMLKAWESLPPIFTSSSSSRLGRTELLDYIDHCLKTV